jgi:tetratricopeptide (TPR) repeat protein
VTPRSTSLAVVLVLAGCAPLRLGPGASVVSVRAAASAEGLRLSDPLELTDEMRERVEVAIGRQGTERQRMEKLNRWLREPTGLGFTYDATSTLSAREAWQKRSGDCLSFAHLFNALARHSGVPVKYVRYREAQGFEERTGQFTVVTHVASLYADYKVNILVELTGRPPSWRSSDYEVISDGEALALHGSNLAMEELAQGRVAQARRWLEALAKEAPFLPEVANNLAVVLMRQGQNADALALLERTIQHAPQFVPLYVNAAIAARQSGQPAVAERYAEAARSSWTDPFLPFVRGTWLYEQGKFAAAVKLFERANSLKPRSVLFLAWLARARLGAGDVAGGRAAFAEAVAANPLHPVLEEFHRLHPALADASPGQRPVEDPVGLPQG